MKSIVLEEIVAENFPNWQIDIKPQIQDKWIQTG